MNKWKRHAIADLPNFAMFIQDADLDCDGDLDIISSGWYNPEVWLNENLQNQSSKLLHYDVR